MSEHQRILKTRVPPRTGFAKWLDLPIRTKGIVVISIPLCAVLFAVIAAEIFQHQRAELTDWIARAFQAGTRIQSVVTLLVEAEDGVRGFRLTQDASYLGPYQRAEASLAGRLTGLRKALSDSPTQIQRIDRVEAISRDWLQNLKSVIDAKDPSTVRDRLERGRSLMNSIESEFAAMRGEEGELWIRRIAAETALRKRLSWGLYAAAGIGVVAGVLSMFLFVMGISTRLQLLRENAGRLVRREPLVSLPPGSDEIGQLVEEVIESGRLLSEQEAELRQLNNILGSRVNESTVQLGERTVQLQESQERFQILTESLPHLVWTCTPDGWCDYLSSQWVEYTGQPAESQLGHGWKELLHPEDRERVQAAWSEAAAGGVQFDVEFRIRRADGSYRWFKTRAVPLRDAAGDIVKWYGSNTDFEEHKRIEQKLHDQLDRMNLLSQITRAIGDRQDLRSIFQSVLGSLEERLQVAFACVCTYDPDEETLTVTCTGARSHAVAETLGLAEQTTVHTNQNGLARCVRGKLVYEPDTRVLDLPFPARLAKGGLFSVVAAPLSFESRAFGILIAARPEQNGFSSGECEFLRQLSEHVALAAQQAQVYAALHQAYDDLRLTQDAVMQQERLRALGQMASGIAHDLNNALFPLTGYTSLLKREPNLSERARKFLDVMEQAGDDAKQTMARLSDFYRQRESRLNLLPVKLNTLVPQVVDLTRARWSDMPQKRGIVVRVLTELAPDLPDVAAVESEIREALTNLVFNAVDAMPDGGILTLRTSVVPQNGSVSLEVVDTGVGMDAEALRRCLEPFYTTKGVRGTGLGLAMVYGTVQRHGAEIKIESTSGHGTTVRLIFPALRMVADPTHGGEVPSIPSNLRILIVDDDPLVIRSLNDILEADGHRVTSASGGREGIDAFDRAEESDEQFDIVISDLGMPYLDGGQVAAAIKAKRASTPIILLTGWGQRLMADRDVPQPVDRVVSKPPKLAELRAAIGELTGAAKRFD